MPTPPPPWPPPPPGLPSRSTFAPSPWGPQRTGAYPPPSCHMIGRPPTTHHLPSPLHTLNMAARAPLIEINSTLFPYISAPASIVLALGTTTAVPALTTSVHPGAVKLPARSPGPPLRRGTTSLSQPQPSTTAPVSALSSQLTPLAPAHGILLFGATPSS